MKTIEELRKYARAAERGSNPETRTTGLIALPGGLLVRADMLGMRGVPREATVEIKEDRVEIRWTRGYTRIEGVELKLTGGLNIPGEHGGLLPLHHPDADPVIHRLRKSLGRPLSEERNRKIQLKIDARIAVLKERAQ